MADTQTFFFRHRLIDQDSENLLLEFYAKTLTTPEHLIIWKSSALLDSAQDMQPREICTQTFEQEETEATPLPPIHRVPVLSLQSPTPFEPGQMVEDPQRNLLGRIKEADDVWITIETPMAWIRGRRVRIESELLKRRPASEREKENGKQTISLHPIQDAH